MSDLIRREDVFKAIVELTTRKTVDEIEILCDASVADSEGWLGGIRDALRAVEYIPFAEPERKKGEWNEIIGTSAFLWLRCSYCGYGADRKTNYCPNCGVDMRGDR